LSIGEGTLIANHLRTCASCQQEAALWKGVAEAVAAQYHDLRPTLSSDDAWYALSARLTEQLPRTAAPMPAAQRLGRIGMAARLNMVAALIRMQCRLIRREVWALPALTLLVALGLLLTSWPWHDRLSALSTVSTLLGSTAVVFLYNRETDAARELTLTTKMRPGAILLLRLGLVAAYLSFVYGACFAVFVGAGFRVSADGIVTSWLAPLSCLAAITLLVANLAPMVVALVTCAGLWALRGLAGLPTFHALPMATAFDGFWHSGSLLGAASLATLMATLLLLERRERLE
jgi:hypothetical protein